MSKLIAFRAPDSLHASLMAEATRTGETLTQVLVRRLEDRGRHVTNGHAKPSPTDDAATSWFD